MEYNVEKKEIVSSRILSELDKFIIDFKKILEKYSSYVIISGYVSILLGRTRATEDIDLFIPEIPFEKFDNFFNDISNKFECMNSSDSKDAYSYLKSGTALRFFYSGFPVPNIELKFIKTDFDRFAFINRIKVVLKEESLFISPLELQIAFKLYLGSDKDFEDAKHLYNLFEEKLDKEKLELFAKRLNVLEGLNKLK